MPSEKDLRFALAILRVARGWNQDDLAKASGVRNNLLSDYERGKKTPGLRNLRKLVAAMGYRISALEAAERFLFKLSTEHRLLEGEEPEDELLDGELESGANAVPDATEAPPTDAALRAQIQQVSNQIGQAVTSAVRLLFVILRSRGGNGEG